MLGGAIGARAGLGAKEGDRRAAADAGGKSLDESDPPTTPESHDTGQKPGPLQAAQSAQIKAVTSPSRPKQPQELTLGASPRPTGEDCDLRRIIAAAEDEQNATFGDVTGALGERPTADMSLAEAAEVLAGLHHGFGDDEKSPT